MQQLPVILDLSRAEKSLYDCDVTLSEKLRFQNVFRLH